MLFLRDIAASHVASSIELVWLDACERFDSSDLSGNAYVCPSLAGEKPQHHTTMRAAVS